MQRSVRLSKKRDEVALVNDQQMTIAQRDGIGGALAGVEQRHLAENFDRP